jgi:hypothetical protein
MGCWWVDMIPINNSDTAWLIVSDYNQENDLPYEDLREDILNPDCTQFYFEIIANCVGGNCGKEVGGLNDIVGNSANTIKDPDVGENCGGLEEVGHLVGGFEQ